MGSYRGQAWVLIIVLCVAFEGSSYGWNTALKIPYVLSHLIPVTTTVLPSFLMRRMVRRMMHAFYIKSIVMPDHFILCLNSVETS